MSPYEISLLEGCLGHQSDEPREEKTYRVAPRRRRRKRARIWILPLLMSLALFAGGFFLGRTAAREAMRATAPETLVPTGAIPPIVADTSAQHTEEGEWALRLINFEHLLPADFTVPELTALSNQQSVDSRVASALQKMLEDAKKEGLQPIICSSFRTWEKQEKLYLKKVLYYKKQGYAQKRAEEKASFWVARPGTSEHQAGLAVDIVSKDYQVLDERQEKTELQQWLVNHCAEYGFILRYPVDKSDLTQVGYEPWHYRYVGIEAAQSIMERGICLEEYLAELETQEQTLMPPTDIAVPAISIQSIR